MLINLNTTESQIIQQNKVLLGGQSINLRARQLVYVMASMLDKDNPTAVISFGAKDFLNFINSPSVPGTKKRKRWSDIYALTHDIFDHLNDNPILLKKPRGKDFTKINWLSSLSVSKGMINARFSPDIAEYFLYKQGLLYTKVLWDLRAYRSNFTARLLDLFQKYHIKESGKSELSFEYDLKELRFFFGIEEKQYPRFFDFEKRVLKVAQDELEKNDQVPYWFDYKKIKKGKAIKSILFEVYIRKAVLLKAIPELRITRSAHKGQASLFDMEGKQQFSQTKTTLLDKLTASGIAEDYALKILSNLSDTQGMGYHWLVDYGVNRNLAFNIIKDHCSFGELAGYEHLYVKHALAHIEEARLKRIQEVQKGSSSKRITPKDKRGALPKENFIKQRYLPSFMERLSDIRREEYESQNDRTQETKGLSDILKGFGPK